MACRLINSPITGEEVTSKTWDDLYNITNDEQEADKLYEQLLSPEFLTWFGDWVNSEVKLNNTNEYGEPFAEELNKFNKSIDNIYLSMTYDSLDSIAKGFNLTYTQIDNVRKGFKTSKGNQNKNTINSINNWLKKFDKYNDIRALLSPYGFIVFYNPLSKKFYSNPSLNSSVASTDTLNKVKEYLKRIGVDLETLTKAESSNIASYYGAKEGTMIEGIADLLQKTIWLTEGKEASALPEEVMHFVVDIIEQTNPKLFNTLYNKVTNYKLYDQLLNSEYKELYSKNGKLDVRKLKKEAMGKLLAEYAILQNEGSVSKPELLEEVETSSNVKSIQDFWLKIVDFLKNLFKKPGFDPFADVANQVLENTLEGSAEDIVLKDDEVYFKLEEQSSIYSDIINKEKDIIKENNTITVNGVELKYNINKKAEKNKKEKSRKEIPEKIETTMSSIEDNGRKDITVILDSKIDENGYLRNEQLPINSVSFLDPKSNKYYNTLDKYFNELLETYPEGTRFIYNKEVYATKDNTPITSGLIDFTAIFPDGTVDLLNWAFINISDKANTIPFNIKEAENIKISDFKKLLKENYNVKNFNKTRAIPIRIMLTNVNNKYYTLNNLQIGTKDSSKEILKPIIPLDERTSLKEIDALLDRLVGLYNQIKDTPFVQGRKDIKKEELNKLNKAIRDLQLNQNLDLSLSYIETLNKETEQLLKEYDTFLRPDFDPTTLSDKEVSFYAGRIIDLQDKYTAFSDIEELKILYLNNEDSINKIKEISDLIKENSKKLQEFSKDYVNKVIGDRTNVQGLLVAEKEQKSLSSWYRGINKASTRALRAFYDITNPLFNKSAIEIGKEYEVLKAIQKDYMEWARNNNISTKNLFDLVMKKDSNGIYTGERIDTIQKEFFKHYWNAVNKKDQKWIEDNIDVERFKNEIKELKDSKIERITTTRWDANDEINKTRIKEEIKRVEDNYDLTTPKSFGWFNPEMRYYSKSKWYTKEYQEILKNTPVLNLWEYMDKKINEAADLGVIDNEVKRTFLPFVYKYNLAEKFTFNKPLKAGQAAIDLFTISEDELNYGYIDPVSKEIKKKIPFRFITKRSDVGNEYLSSQLFENLYLFNNEIIKYNNLLQIEDQVKLLQRVEQSKQSIKTNMYGRVPGDSVELNKDNDVNSKLLDDMVNGILYQQKYLESTFEQALGTFGPKFDRTAKKINEFLGINALPTNLSGKGVSAIKVWEGMGNLFQAKILGLNIMIPIANLIGGNIQAMTGAGNFFTKRDFGKAEWMFSTRDFSGPKGAVYSALLDYLNPMVFNYDRERLKTLSVSKLANLNMSDVLFKFQEKSDKLVQGPIALAMLDNTIVLDGKLINARKYIKDKYKQELFSNKEGIKDKIEKEIKELIQTNGIINKASIVNDKLVIEGIDLDSLEFPKLRSKIQNITQEVTGVMPEGVRAKYSMTILGRSFMTFKNWIPPLTEKRFGDLTYKNGLEEWEIGRTRAVLQVLKEGLFKSVVNIKNIYQGNEKGLALLDKILEKKKNIYFKENGSELEISKEDYYEAMIEATRQEMRDWLFYATLAGLFFTAVKLPPEDEDKQMTGYWKFYVRLLNKAKDEISFYYNPLSFVEIANGSVIPALGVMTDATKILTSTLNQTTGFITNNEEMMDKAHPLKYILKSIPIGNQLNYYLATLSPEYAKDMGIQLTVESRR